MSTHQPLRPAEPTTVILCGGKGTRAYPHTLGIPKPLIQVGPEPVLWHLMHSYAIQGFTDFVLATGYLGEQIEAFAKSCPDGWVVEAVDTGAETGTGGRILHCADLVGDRFLATYGDGLGDVDIVKLLDFHERHGGLATVTTVPLRSPYGTVESDDTGRVTGFTEKPTLADHWINVGFFVFERQVFEHWAGDDLERDVLPALARQGMLFAYRHRGFWRSMDTHKDAQELGALWNGENSPWMLSMESRFS